jgi:putative ubiquitin-RnfH superfamily antitoxin RatB of RatAB toxin-antitoxin module
MASAETTPMRIELFASPGPRQSRHEVLHLAAGTTVAEALRLAGWLDESGHVAAVWGRHVEPDHPLRDGDRIEWLRPLQVDPKEARRQRYRGHTRQR